MKPIIYLIIPLILALTACMSEKTVIMKYYVLEIPANHSSGNQRSKTVIKGVCQVDQIEISPILETNQIINRSNSHEITYYRYHQWAIRPGTAVKKMVQNRLESSGIFEDVYTRHSRSIPDYRLHTYLKQLEVIERNDSFSTHVNLAFEITDNEDDIIILKHQANRTNELQAKDLNQFAEEVTNIIQEELDALITKIEDNKSLFTKDPTL